MQLHEYARYDATGLAELIGRGEITPQELARLAADAVARANPRIGAIVELFEDLLDDPSGNGMDPTGVFGGVPMFLKDMGSAISGRRQAQGIAWLKDWVSDHTDPLIDNFHRAGLFVLGRSACPELGTSFDTSSPGFGIARNPWDLERTPGGSSGGSAAAIAARVVPVASASDGGGSTRFPASWCGLVGLKPTRGLLPLPQGLHEAAIYPAVEGALTRTVRDAARIYDRLWPKRRGWGFVEYGEPGWRLEDELEAPPRHLRIALSTGAWGQSEAAAPAVVARVLDTARALEGLGHTVEEVKDESICDFSALWQSYKSWGWDIPCSEGFAELAALVGVQPSAADSSPQLLHHLALAGSASAADVMAALAQNVEVTRQWGRFWDSGWDLLLCPVAAIECPRAGAEYSTLDPSPFDVWFERLASAARYTVPGNEAGLPGISVPAGFDSAGLPVGAQLYAPWRRENDLIHIAAQLERALPEQFDASSPFEFS